MKNLVYLPESLRLIAPKKPEVREIELTYANQVDLIYQKMLHFEGVLYYTFWFISPCKEIGCSVFIAVIIWL